MKHVLQLVNTGNMIGISKQSEFWIRIEKILGHNREATGPNKLFIWSMNYGPAQVVALRGFFHRSIARVKLNWKR